MHLESRRSVNRENPFGPTQTKILQYLVDGLPNDVAIKNLGIKRSAYNSHTKNILDKILDIWLLGEGELTVHEALERAKQLGIERGFLIPKEP